MPLVFSVARRWPHFTAQIRHLNTQVVPRFDPNGFFGLNTQYGWLAIPKQYYASHWTLDGVHEAIDAKYPGVDKSQLSFGELQAVVDEWVAATSLNSKPKSTKISKAEKLAKEEYNLFRLQVRVITEPIISMADMANLSEEEREQKTKAREKLTEERKAQRKEELKIRRQLQLETKKKAYKYMMEHNRPPPDFDFGLITLTHAWNHFVSKYYNSLEENSLADKRQVLSQKWKTLSKHEKQTYRIEYIEMMKRGEAYDCSEIVLLSEKAKRLL